MNSDYLLGDNLLFLRGLMGVTQEHVAKLLHMSRSAYAAIESGSRKPNVNDLHLLEQVTRFSAETLISVDLRKQMVLVLEASRQASDGRAFINDYLKLSESGRKRIDDYIDQTLERESALMAVLTTTEEKLDA